MSEGPCLADMLFPILLCSDAGGEQAESGEVRYPVAGQWRHVQDEEGSHGSALEQSR